MRTPQLATVRCRSKLGCCCYRILRFSYRRLRCLPSSGRANIAPAEVRQVKKWTETNLEKQLAYIKKSAWQHAGEQMNIAEMHLRKHPGENAAFDFARHRFMIYGKEAGFPICGRLPVGPYEICWDDCDGGLYARCDGSGTSALCRREQEASVSAGRAIKQRRAACMPFDRMAQAEWESEHESPHCLSH